MLVMVESALVGAFCVRACIDDLVSAAQSAFSNGIESWLSPRFGGSNLVRIGLGRDRDHVYRREKGVGLRLPLYACITGATGPNSIPPPSSRLEDFVVTQVSELHGGGGISIVAMHQHWPADFNGSGTPWEPRDVEGRPGI